MKIWWVIWSQLHEVFNVITDKARENNKTEWDRKHVKYIKEGLTREEARENAIGKMKSKDLQTFVTNYTALIQYILLLKHGSIIIPFMDDVAFFLSRAYCKRNCITLE